MSLKCTIIMSDGKNQASETYLDLDSNIPASQSNYDNVQSLCDARSNLLGDGASILACRVSTLDRSNAPVFIYNGSRQNPTPWKAPFFTRNLGGGNSTAEPGRTVVQALLIAGNARNSSKYMSFFPDCCIAGQAGGVASGVNLGGFFTNNVNLSGYWSQWVSLLTNGSWGLRVKANSGSVVQMTGYAFATGTNYPMVTTTSAVGVAVGDYVQIRGVKGSAPFSSANGIFKVLGIGGGSSTFTYTVTPQRRAPAGWTWGGVGTIQGVHYQSNAITAVTIGQVTEHARGNSLFLRTKGKAGRKT